MEVTAEQLAEVCGIAHNSSRRGDGRSLRECIAESQYGVLRPGITKAMLLQYFATHPEVVQQWKAFSEDKRTRAGWCLVGGGTSWEVRRAEGGGTCLYDSGEEACADFMLKELDFWVSLRRP